MAFTYDLTQNRGNVRINVADTVENQGPRPDGRNFSDAEIDHFLTEETSIVEAATARLFEILASEWTQYALSEKEADLSFDAKGVANLYMRRAEEWWDKSGRNTSGKPGFSQHEIIYHLGYGNT